MEALFDPIEFFCTVVEADDRLSALSNPYQGHEDKADNAKDEAKSRNGDLPSEASEDIVEKSGAWYSFDGERIGQGRENVKRFMVDNEDIKIRITELIKEKTGLKKSDSDSDDKEKIEAKG